MGPLIRSDQPVLRYGTAIILVLAIGALRWALTPLAGTEAPFLPFLLAVLTTAWLGGRGPALLATLLTPVLVTPLFTAWPNGTHHLAYATHVGLFLVMAAATTLLVHRLQMSSQAQQKSLQAALAAERLASASESRLRLITDALPVLIAYVDVDHRYRFNNKRYEEWFGKSPEMMSMREILGETAYASVEPRMAAALAGRRTNFETQFPHHTAGLRQVEAHYVPDVDPEGTVRGCFVLVTDITERKRTEQSLRDARQSLSLALLAGRAGSFDWNIVANINLWSEELLALYGFSAGEFDSTHEGWLGCIDPDDRELMRERISRALVSGQITAEFRIRRRDSGEIRWMHARGKVFYDETHQPVRMLAIHADITERKQAEEALRESERRLTLIYDNSSDALCLLEVDATRAPRVLSVNERFLSVAGLVRADVEHRPIDELERGIDPIKLRAACEEVIQSQRPLIYDEAAELLAGHRHSEITLIPIIVGETVTHILAASKDVTQKHLAEEALREADRRKDDFLAMLAHELRNPLAPIRNVAHVLSNHDVDAAVVRRQAEILQRQASQLAHLVDDLLDVARITRGLIELKRAPVQLNAVIESAVEAVQPLIAVKHQRLSVTRSAEPLWMDGDAVRLSQAIGNLLTNAAKYSPDRSQIEVMVDATEDEAIIRVIDHGVGIDAEVLPHVFELFMQADRSLDRSQGGLGVGLTIVKALIEMHGGTVEARSAGVAQGSEFIVRLPVSSALQAGAGIHTPTRTPPARLRVLVVDDSVDAAETLCVLLEVSGHEVRMAHDAAAAFAALETFDAQVIVLDIGLPGTDGYVVAQAIRERFPREGRRLYALTGYGSPEDRALALSAGFDDHLTKPVDPVRLLQLIAPEPTASSAPNGISQDFKE